MAKLVRDPYSAAAARSNPARPKQGYWASRGQSLRAAWDGVVYVARTQPNAQLEAAITAVVIGAGLLVGLQPAEWAALLLTCGMVLALEAVNTAVEVVVDLVSPDHHPLAKIAKDAAAAAMIVAVAASIGVGVALFAPRLWQWLGG